MARITVHPGGTLRAALTFHAGGVDAAPRDLTGTSLMFADYDAAIDPAAVSLSWVDAASGAAELVISASTTEGWRIGERPYLRLGVVHPGGDVEMWPRLNIEVV